MPARTVALLDFAAEHRQVGDSTTIEQDRAAGALFHMLRAARDRPAKPGADAIARAFEQRAIEQRAKLSDNRRANWEAERDAWERQFS